MAAEKPRRLSASPRENASAAASLVAMQRYADGFRGLRRAACAEDTTVATTSTTQRDDRENRPTLSKILRRKRRFVTCGGNFCSAKSVWVTSGEFGRQ